MDLRIVCIAKVKVFEKCMRFKERYKWGLTPHSVEEVDRFNAGLKKLEKVDSKGASYFDDALLTPAMLRFIQNERALAALSAEYFLTRYFAAQGKHDIQHSLLSVWATSLFTVAPAVGRPWRIHRHSMFQGQKAGHLDAG